MLSIAAYHSLAGNNTTENTLEGIFQRSLRNTFRPAIEVVVPIERKVCVNAFFSAFERWREDASRHRPNQTMYL